VDTVVLQDWITITGPATQVPVVQSSHCYLDIGHYEDLVAYLDVRQVTASVALSYQTAPTQDDAAFLNMLAPFSVATGLQVSSMFFAFANVPPARFVRWSLAGPGTSTWVMSFRIILAAYNYAPPDAPPVQCPPACC